MPPHFEERGQAPLPDLFHLRGSNSLKLPLVLPLDRVDLGDALSMAFFANLGRKPGRNNLAHLCAADRLASERQHVCVVVFAGVACNLNRITRRSTNTWNFIRRHRAADACAIDHDPEIRTAVSNRPRDCVCKIGIVNGVFGIRSKVLHLVSEIAQHHFEFFLHFEPTVVRADRNDFRQPSIRVLKHAARSRSSFH